MQRFRNILLVVDDATALGKAFERALVLAWRNHARLAIATVVDALPPEMRRLTLAFDPTELLDLAVQKRLAQLEMLVEPERQEGLEISTKVLCGMPFLKIIRQVLREEHDLVVMTAEKRVSLAEALFGSTSMHLMRKCPCPVWVMSPAQRHHYARILAAVDPTSSDGTHQSLNLRIMELATSLARIERSALHVVHAWRPFTKRLFSSGNRLPTEQCASAHEHALSGLLAGINLKDLRVHPHIVRGEAVEAIPALARHHQVDVIVMGTVCRTGSAGLFIGNTAEKVLRRARCSVLTVKPAWFVTPVNPTQDLPADSRLTSTGIEGNPKLQERGTWT